MSSVYYSIVKPVCFTFILIWALVAYVAAIILLTGMMQGDVPQVEATRLITISGASAICSVLSGLLHVVLRYVFTFDERYY